MVLSISFTNGTIKASKAENRPIGRSRVAILRVVSEISEKSAGRDNKHNHIANCESRLRRHAVHPLPGPVTTCNYFPAHRIESPLDFA